MYCVIQTFWNMRNYDSVKISVIARVLGEKKKDRKGALEIFRSVKIFCMIL